MDTSPELKDQINQETTREAMRGLVEKHNSEFPQLKVVMMDDGKLTCEHPAINIASFAKEVSDVESYLQRVIAYLEAIKNPVREERRWVELRNETDFIHLSPLSLYGDFDGNYEAILSAIPGVERFEKLDPNWSYYRIFPKKGVSMKELNKSINNAFGKALTPKDWETTDWAIFLDCLRGQLRHGASEVEVDRIAGRLPEVWTRRDMEDILQELSREELRFYKGESMIKHFVPNQEELSRMRMTIREILSDLENIEVAEGEQRYADFD